MVIRNASKLGKQLFDVQAQCIAGLDKQKALALLEHYYKEWKTTDAASEATPNCWIELDSGEILTGNKIRGSNEVSPFFPRYNANNHKCSLSYRQADDFSSIL
jgi:hypothetical protein